MMRVIVVDDEAPARAKLVRLLTAQPDVSVVAEAADGKSALEKINQLRPDVVLLDIQMPGMTGLELAEQLAGDVRPWIVFVTAYHAHAIEAFDLNAIDYLLKPYDLARFERMLARVRPRVAKSAGDTMAAEVAKAGVEGPRRLLVPHGSGFIPVPCDDILWLEAQDNYVLIHLESARYLLRATLTDLVARLGPEYLRTHRSIAVNINQVHKATSSLKGDYQLTLSNGERIKLSRHYRDAVLAALGA